MIFLPLVGVIIAAVLLLWQYLSLLLNLNVFVYGAGLAVLPLLITGSIHMDGFCDTVDALASNGDKETKQRILKDPHTGAFAVIGAVAYLLAFAALGSELAGKWTLLICLCCVFVLSRALGGLAMMWFPSARADGLAHAFAKDSQKTVSVVVLLGIALICCSLMVGFGGLLGVAAIVCSLLVFLALRFWLVKGFGGLSGDLVGWCIQSVELCALAGLVLVDKILLLL